MSSTKEGTSCAPFHSTVCEVPTLAEVFGRLCSFNACSFDCKPSGVMSGRRFPVQTYCGREEHQVPPALSAGGLDGSLPQISACLGNLGIPSAPSRLTLVLSSLSSAVVPRTEKVALPRSPERLHKREKNLISSTFKTSEYACKKNYNRTRGKGRH